MSNLVKNSLKIHGPKGILALIMDNHCPVVSSGDSSEQSFSFDSIVPMPPDLAVSVSSVGQEGWRVLYGSREEKSSILERLGLASFSGEALRRELAVRFPEHFNLGETYQKNISLYGHPTWREWCIEHWGCQRYADEVTVDQIEEDLFISFSTPNLPPLPVYIALSGKYPQCRFRFSYYETINYFNGGGDAYQGNLLLRDESQQCPYESEYTLCLDKIKDLRASSSTNSEELIKELINLGAMYCETTDPDEALPLLLEALDFQKQSKASGKDMAATLELIARCHEDSGKKTLAENALSEAIALRIKDSPDRDNLRRLYFDYVDLAHILMKLGRSDESGFIKKKGELIWQKIFSEE